VSLCCSYFVTWKADGTRYVMLLLKWGTYLIDWSGEVSATAVQCSWQLLLLVRV
jgi:mRNA-capping enzyme